MVRESAADIGEVEGAVRIRGGEVEIALLVERRVGLVVEIDGDIGEGVDGAASALDHLAVDFDRGLRADLAHAVDASGRLAPSRCPHSDAASRGESRVADLLGDSANGGAIMPAGLVGESEVRKENDGAEGHAPAGELEGDFGDLVVPPVDRGELVDATEVAVGVLPAQPGLNTDLDVESDNPASERHVEDDIGRGESHEADVSAGAEVAVAGEQLGELGMTLIELANAHNAVDTGDASDENGWADDQGECDGGVVGEGEATDVLEDVKAVTLGNILKDHAEDRETEADSQVDHDCPALFSLGHGDRLDRSNVVKASVNAERCSRDGPRASNNEPGGDIAPDGSNVAGVSIPYDGIDELKEASQSCPKHEQACSCIPSFQMPWQGDSAEKETKERK